MECLQNEILCNDEMNRPASNRQFTLYLDIRSKDAGDVSRHDDQSAFFRYSSELRFKATDRVRRQFLLEKEKILPKMRRFSRSLSG